MCRACRVGGCMCGCSLILPNVWPGPESIMSKKDGTNTTVEPAQKSLRSLLGWGLVAALLKYLALVCPLTDGHAACYWP